LNDFFDGQIFLFFLIIRYDASNLKFFAQVAGKPAPVDIGVGSLETEAVDILIKTIISIRF